MEKNKCRRCWNYANGVCIDPEERLTTRCSRRIKCSNFIEKPLVIMFFESIEKIFVPWF